MDLHLYKNCHYKYKGRICELIDFVPDIASVTNRVRISFWDNTEMVCSQSDLAGIPMTESILQSCYKSKTYDRDSNWDIIWHLGIHNSITVGEKSGHYYLVPPDNSEKIVVDILPWEIIKSVKAIKYTDPIELTCLNELEKYLPEVRETLRSKWIKSNS